jgi:pYEATS domain-containing protein involved in immunity
MTTPAIRASFELDAEGRPEAIQSGDLQHFRIKLNVDGAPRDTYAVTYVLDPSYRSPTREVLDGDTSFEESLTSYGDYTVQAKIRTPTGVTVIAAPLSRALRKTYGASPTPEVEAALQLLASR